MYFSTNYWFGDCWPAGPAPTPMSPFLTLYVSVEGLLFRKEALILVPRLNPVEIAGVWLQRSDLPGVNLSISFGQDSRGTHVEFS